MSEWIDAVILAVVAFYCGFISGRQYKKRPVDFHVEVNKDLMPSQEQLDAGGGEGSKRFAEVYIKALQKNK